ncbi:reductive dehalogenase membrane anchor BvcB [Dehalococcoides mccartyi]|uniref:Putative membrane anchor for vinnyl chloride reductase n=2 Tax=Dehalococcoides TaxID=61434 RepID=G5EJ78_9CHLR|nr:hypothetical protein [Dehalococcoides mccartyi]BAL14740.1 putative membrane anchor for vinnyl chloride reductase [uncultured Dehalococcoides sp.]AQU05942.1 reductive dehalogenase membrane anchor BvcB [Dehalococcoides mccartyi]AQU07387.1 reductive dehalogenase membrane anchor BvcB [Dehalococcoides mccartyi]AQW62491.1 reductive dehalogenase membrane anchor BvcB [Dehalococcoides mccartyi]BAL14742.1 putative membrane anchor for vinnyl chloride reductase [uncultured Dehalococcoides sp.]
MSDVQFFALISFILGIGLTLFYLFLHNRKIVIKWWEWLIMAVILSLVLFAIGHIWGSVAVEGEYKSAWGFGGIIIGLAMILSATVYRLIRSRYLNRSHGTGNKQ